MFGQLFPPSVPAFFVIAKNVSNQLNFSGIAMTKKSSTQVGLQIQFPNIVLSPKVYFSVSLSGVEDFSLIPT
ncbi:hypothetical protein AXA65_14560 [Chryseobacterium sp. FP211-J200]|nr:hypothetical protein AXA65_14560 [Chryseobacterium sp. FP211-J200]